MPIPMCPSLPNHEPHVVVVVIVGGGGGGGEVRVRTTHGKMT